MAKVISDASYYDKDPNTNEPIFEIRHYTHSGTNDGVATMTSVYLSKKEMKELHKEIKIALIDYRESE